jgi:hypothetical protein
MLSRLGLGVCHTFQPADLPRPHLHDQHISQRLIRGKSIKTQAASNHSPHRSIFRIYSLTRQRVVTFASGKLSVQALDQ